MRFSATVIYDENKKSYYPDNTGSDFSRGEIEWNPARNQNLYHPHQVWVKLQLALRHLMLTIGSTISHLLSPLLSVIPFACSLDESPCVPAVVLYYCIFQSTVRFSSVQLFSRVRLFVTLWTAAHQASQCITNSRSSPKLMSIESVMPSNHLILHRPLLLLPSISPSIRIFSNESALRIWWPKYWSFNFNISPSNEHPGLISFRMDWLDLLAVQGTRILKASILRRSAFFIVQLSYPYMTTGKTISLSRWTFVDKVMSLLFNMLSRLVPSKE